MFIMAMTPPRATPASARTPVWKVRSMAPKQPPWKRPAPPGQAPRKQVTSAEIKAAKARADTAGRRYPNLVDNMWALRQRRLSDR